MIIGLTGPEGAGKSTAAQFFARKVAAPIVPFAGPLKDMLRAIGVEEKHLTGSPADKAAPLPLLAGRSARHAMQTLGTEWGRECLGPSFWADAWAHRVAAAGGRAIADDVRFLTEIDAIKAAGGVVIQIIRHERDLTRVPRHPSEDFASLPFDLRVLNDQCTYVFGQRLMAAYRSIKTGQPYVNDGSRTRSG